MDWNNDGKKDLISGDTRGQVWVFLNTGTDQAPELAAGVRVQAGGVPIIASRYAKGASNKAMGKYSKLHYCDWDGDGLEDLLIGQDGLTGSEVVFYKNTGTESEPKFSGPKLLKIPGPKIRRPSPYVIDWDADGRQDLLLGTDKAEVYFLRNTGTTSKPELRTAEKLRLGGGEFSKGYRCRIDVTDWNEDGNLDLLVGNFYSYRKPMGGNVWLFLGK